MRKFYCEETRFSKGKIAGIIACIQTNGYKSSGIVFHRLENYDEERKVYIYIYRCFFPSLNIVEWKKEKKKKGRNEEEAAIGSPWMFLFLALEEWKHRGSLNRKKHLNSFFVSVLSAFECTDSCRFAVVNSCEERKSRIILSFVRQRARTKVFIIDECTINCIVSFYFVTFFFFQFYHNLY